MAEGSEGFQGWMLAEALQRTADPDLWKAWTNTKSGPGHGATPAAQDPSAFASGLWTDLSEGRLGATGSHDKQTETPALIHSSAWSNLVVEDWENSIVRQARSKNKIYNVRFFPLVYCPDAHLRLIGCTLADAFRKCVLDDPEVRRFSNLVPPSYKEYFQEGVFPLPGSESKWPLEVAASDFATYAVNPFYSGPQSPIPEVIQNASRVIVSRWQGLQSVLAEGRISTRGTHVMTGNVVLVDPVQWRRTGLLVQVKNGDLFELEGSKPVLRWSGLTLVAPPISPSQSPAGADYKATISASSSRAVGLPEFHVKPLTSDGALPAAAERKVASAKPTRAMEHIETSAAAYEGCLARFVEVMRANPERSETNEVLWLKAKKQWPSLSERAFFRARAEAIRISGAKGWAAPGAPKKLPRG